MTDIVRLSNNVFDRQFIKKNEYIEMVRNFISTVIILNKNNISDELLNLDTVPTLIDFGLMEKDEELIDLEKILGESLLKNLINAINVVNRLNLLEDSEIAKYHYTTRTQLSKKEIQSGKPTLVDLFCGSGGLSLGFTRAGFRVALANDIEKAAVRTYSFNHPEIDGSHIVYGGIESITNNMNKFVSEKVDVMIGGPPCQGFSMANRQRIIDDPRNILYKHYVECVRQLTPKVFIMENVKGMSNVASQVVEDFNANMDVKYNVSFEILNAKNFGIPQNRERLIYIGIREDVSSLNNVTAKEIFKSIQLNYVDKKESLFEVIKDLKPLEASRTRNSTVIGDEVSGHIIDGKLRDQEIDSDYLKRINFNDDTELVYNHKARYNNDRDIEIYGRMHPGDRADSPRIADIMPYASRNHIFKDKYYKLKPDNVCKTITAHMKFDCNMYIHPYQARGLTPREAARIQSYPDSYLFLGPYTKTYQQIGNSVPPLMANHIAKGVLKYVKRSTLSYCN